MTSAACSRGAGRWLESSSRPARSRATARPDDRGRSAPGGTLDGRGDRPSDGCRHPRPRRWLAGGPVAVQRRGRCARSRGASVSDRRGCRPRDGRDAGRICRRRPCRNSVRGRGAHRSVTHVDEVARIATLAARLQTPPLAHARRPPPAAQQRICAPSTRSAPSSILHAERERIGLLLDRAARVLRGGSKSTAPISARQSELLARASPWAPCSEMGRAWPSVGLPVGPQPVRHAGARLLHRSRSGRRRAARSARVKRGEPINVRLQHGELGARVENVPE